MMQSTTWIQLAQPAPCAWCGTHLATHTVAVQEPASGSIWCVACCTTAEPENPPQHSIGKAGASAHREYERRRAADLERLRRRWGRFGTVAVALSEPRSSTEAWERGAAGERRLGARLDRLQSERVAVLHDRRIPGGRANIDHLVITTSRIWVIDAKRYKGRPERRADGGLFRERTERLFVAGRDRSTLLDGLLTQVSRVQQTTGTMAVTGVLCFIDADWPLFETMFRIRNSYVASPRRLSKLIAKDRSGSIDPARTGAYLADRFPAA